MRQHGDSVSSFHCRLHGSSCIMHGRQRQTAAGSMSESTNTDNTISLAPPQRLAQDFLELVQRSKRGRLKLYVGFAAGVGKTYRMLEEAHALQKRGVDVVAAFVETHGRAETQALLEGLNAVPRKRIEYR